MKVLIFGLGALGTVFKEFIQSKTFLLIAQNGYGNYEKAIQVIPKN